MKLAEKVLKIDTLTDFKDGVLLVALIEILSGKKIDGCVPKPGDKKIVKINNITLALEALSSLGLSTTGLSAAGTEKGRALQLAPPHVLSLAIADGDVSCTLALVWSIIQFYQLDHSAFDSKISGTPNFCRLSCLLFDQVPPTIPNCSTGSSINFIHMTYK